MFNIWEKAQEYSIFEAIMSEVQINPGRQSQQLKVLVGAFVGTLDTMGIKWPHVWRSKDYLQAARDFLSTERIVFDDRYAYCKYFISLLDGNMEAHEGIVMARIIGLNGGGARDLLEYTSEIAEQYIDASVLQTKLAPLACCMYDVLIDDEPGKFIMSDSKLPELNTFEQVMIAMLSNTTTSNKIMAGYQISRVVKMQEQAYIHYSVLFDEQVAPAVRVHISDELGDLCNMHMNESKKDILSSINHKLEDFRYDLANEGITSLTNEELAYLYVYTH